jgi:hypothetical protein
LCVIVITCDWDCNIEITNPNGVLSGLIVHLVSEVSVIGVARHNILGSECTENAASNALLLFDAWPLWLLRDSYSPSPSNRRVYRAVP